jgi:hypothetical protein
MTDAINATPDASIPTETIQDASPDTTAATEATSSADTPIQVKIDGTPYEVSEGHIRKWATETFGAKADGVPVDQLVRHFQKAHSAQARFEAASQKEQMAEKLYELLKTNPRAVLSHPGLGLNLRQFAEEILSEHIQEELMDPKDRELKRLQTELSKRDADRARQQEAQEQEQMTRAEQQLVTAFEESGMKPNMSLAKEVMTLKRLGIQRGADIPAKSLMPVAIQRLRERTAALYDGLPDDQLEANLGGISERLRKLSLAKLKASPTMGAPVPEKVSRPRASASEPKMSKEEYKAQLEALRKG